MAVTALLGGQRELTRLDLDTVATYMRDQRQKKQRTYRRFQARQYTNNQTDHRVGKQGGSWEPPSLGLQQRRLVPRHGSGLAGLLCSKVAQPYWSTAPERCETMAREQEQDGNDSWNPQDNSNALPKDGKFRYLQMAVSTILQTSILSSTETQGGLSALFTQKRSQHVRHGHHRAHDR